MGPQLGFELENHGMFTSTVPTGPTLLQLPAQLEQPHFLRFFTPVNAFFPLLVQLEGIHNPQLPKAGHEVLL